MAVISCADMSGQAPGKNGVDDLRAGCRQRVGVDMVVKRQQGETAKIMPLVA